MAGFRFVMAKVRAQLPLGTPIALFVQRIGRESSKFLMSVRFAHSAPIYAVISQLDREAVS